MIACLCHINHISFQYSSADSVQDEGEICSLEVIYSWIWQMSNMADDREE